MTPYRYMRQHARGIAGGLAWPQHVFTSSSRLSPTALVDAAVDIAWERLKRPRSNRPELEITRRGALIVFRPQEVRP